MRLQRIQDLLRERGMEYRYTEEDGCGSIDFMHRGLFYHIWEFSDGGEPCGAQTNLFCAGRTEDIEGDYETTILRELESFC